MADYTDINTDPEFRSRGKKTRKSFNPRLPQSPDNQPPGPADEGYVFTEQDYIPGPAEGEMPAPGMQAQPSDDDLLGMASGAQPEDSAPLPSGSMQKLKKRPMPSKKKPAAAQEDVW